MGVMMLVGGVGIFLFGMMLLTDTLKEFAGTRLRDRLTRLTDDPFRGALFGATLTTLFQSSTVTTLMTVGFVSAGLMTFQQSLPVIIGSNAGSATTGWIVALLGSNVDVRQVFYPLIGIGMFVRLSSRRFRSLAMLCVSVGLIFVGIGTLQEAMQQTLAFPVTTNLAASFWQQLALIGIGLGMTLVLQSSTVGLVLTMTALATNAITLTQAAFLILGQSAGTSLVVALGSIGTWKAGRRLVLAHLMIHGSILVIGWATFPLLFAVVEAVGDFFGWNPLLRLALFHTAFHVLGVIAFLPFHTTFSRRLLRWLPSRTEKLTGMLNPEMTRVPAVALEASRRSLIEIDRYLARETLRLIEDGERRDEALHLLERTLGEVRLFLSTIQLDATSQPDEYGRHVSYLHAIDHLERWLGVLREIESPEVMQDGSLETARTMLLEALRRTDDLNHHTPSTDISVWKRLSKQLANTRKTQRAEWLEETPSRPVEMLHSFEHVQALLIYDRMGYHLWRATRHLIKPTVPSERFAMNEDE